MTRTEKMRDRSFAVTDAMPPELRQCVHEFGLPIVEACVQSGVTSPAKIRYLVQEVWTGARQLQQRCGAMGTLDWVLVQAGANISAATLARILANHNWAIAPISPTAEMIEASMAEVSGFNERITKREKHRRRLYAALRAALTYFDPVRRAA